MEKQAFTVAIFITCFLNAISDHIQKNELKGFTERNSDVGHRFLDHLKAIRARMHKLIGNNQDISDSSSMIQYARGLLGLNSRSASLENQSDLPKVSFCRDKKVTYEYCYRIFPSMYQETTWSL